MSYWKVFEDEKEVFYSRPFPLTETYVELTWVHALGISAVYMLLVLWGMWRKYRGSPPIVENGKWILRGYNYFQILICLYSSYLISITFLPKLIRGIKARKICQPQKVVISDDFETYELETYACWFYLVCKWFDFIDTILIIIRNKWRQLSFLHVFHHLSMAFLSWMAFTYYPSGYFLMCAQVNAPVHVIMYLYYFCSSFPKLTPFTMMWKRYVTSIQLIQFVIATSYSYFCFGEQLFSTELKNSLVFMTIMSLFGTSQFLLFSDFYSKNYKKQDVMEDSKETITGESTSSFEKTNNTTPQVSVDYKKLE